MLTMAFNPNISSAIDNNVVFSGALVSQPCTLPDSDTDISLDLGTIVNKYLYQNQRTESIEFGIHLLGCNIAVQKMVSVTFGGIEQEEMPGYLALDPVSTAKGVAIGLESMNNTFIPINEPTQFSVLSEGNNVLSYKAFVKILPTAANEHSLIEGSFTAVSTFVLTYQ